MRSQTIAVTLNKPGSLNLNAIRGERLQIALTGSSAPRHILTISDTPDGAPLIEIPADGAVLTLNPADLQILREGAQYCYNIWAQDGTDRMQLLWGRLLNGNSIAPSGAEYPTTFLEGFGQQGGPQRLIVLSKAAYDGLAAPDPAFLYLIREDM